jgi:hypothetical protein
MKAEHSRNPQSGLAPELRQLILFNRSTMRVYAFLWTLRIQCPSCVLAMRCHEGFMHCEVPSTLSYAASLALRT